MFRCFFIMEIFVICNFHLTSFCAIWHLILLYAILFHIVICIFFYFLVDRLLFILYKKNILSLSVYNWAFQIHISTVGKNVLGKVNTVVHKKETNSVIYTVHLFCRNVLHVNWNFTYVYSFLHTMLSFPYINTLTYLPIALPQQATVNVSQINVTQMYCTNINVFIQYCCSSLGLWHSSLLTNGRIVLGKLYMLPNLIDL